MFLLIDLKKFYSHLLRIKTYEWHLITIIVVNFTIFSTTYLLLYDYSIHTTVYDRCLLCSCNVAITLFNLFPERYRFPDSSLNPTTLLITIVVDTRNNNCHDSIAYIADVNERHLYVYDFANDKSWSVSNNLFYPYPFYGDFHINGVDFDLMDGIFGLALGN